MGAFDELLGGPDTWDATRALLETSGSVPCPQFHLCSWQQSKAIPTNNEKEKNHQSFELGFLRVEREREMSSRYIGGVGVRGRRMSRGMVPLLVFQVISEYHRLGGRKPPVTAGLILTNALIYLRPGVLDRLLPTIDQVWFNPHLILKYGDLKRFFLSAFYHMGESHLVYNMMSLLWKGLQLETSMGSLEFTSMVAALLGLSQGITLLMAKGLLLFFDYENAYFRQYSVGFSGVLFAMKVVLNAQADDYTYIHGLIVPSRHAAWAELILIQLFVPGVSFLGHLGGILAGLVYLQLRRAYSGPDPIAALVRNVAGVVSWPFRLIQSLFRSQSHRISGRGRVGESQPARHASSVWRCPVCTFDNSRLLDVCEMCSTERGGHGFSSVRPSHHTRDLSTDEVRRRRLERFDR